MPTCMTMLSRSCVFHVAALLDMCRCLCHASASACLCPAPMYAPPTVSTTVPLMSILSTPHQNAVSRSCLSMLAYHIANLRSPKQLPLPTIAHKLAAHCPCAGFLMPHAMPLNPVEIMDTPASASPQVPLDSSYSSIPSAFRPYEAQSPSQSMANLSFREVIFHLACISGNAC